MGHLTQGVAAQAKIAVVATRPTRLPAAIVQAGRRAVARQLLNLAMNFQLLALIGRLLKFFEQCFALRSVLCNELLALLLARNHTFFSHEAAFRLISMTQSLIVEGTGGLCKPPLRLSADFLVLPVQG